MKKYLPLAAVLLSGILLVLSFAPFELGVLAWVAFVPLFFVCSGATVRRAAFFGWVSGFVFFYWKSFLVAACQLARLCRSGGLLRALFHSLCRVHCVASRRMA